MIYDSCSGRFDVFFCCCLYLIQHLSTISLCKQQIANIKNQTVEQKREMIFIGYSTKLFRTISMSCFRPCSQHHLISFCAFGVFFFFVQNNSTQIYELEQTQRNATHILFAAVLHSVQCEIINLCMEMKFAQRKMDVDYAA